MTTQEAKAILIQDNPDITDKEVEQILNCLTSSLKLLLDKFIEKSLSNTKQN